jgi:hypothetical protein
VLAKVASPGAELAVRVPSVIIPEEFNILLNPRHEGYDVVRWSDPRTFRFDPLLHVGRADGQAESTVAAGR